MSVTAPVQPLVPSDEEAMLRASVRGITERYGRAYYVQKSAGRERMDELWAELARAGFLGVSLPEEHGGGGMGVTELALVSEEMAALGCPEMFLIMSQSIAGCVIDRHGSPEQRAQFLPAMADGSERFVFAMTEPDAGTNTFNLRTRARRDGDEWVISGQKTYISGVDHGDHVLLVARTDEDPAGRAELTLFLLEPDAPGLERQKIPTMVQAPEGSWMLFLDQVRVPADAVVGDVGGGHKPLFDGLNPERIMGAALSIGLGRYALDRGTRYAKEREVWGRPIGAHQGVAHPLAKAKVHLEVARTQTYRAAALYDAGLPAGEAANMAKYAASEAVGECFDVAIQVHGGNGMAVEYGLADLWGLARLQRIAPVSSEMVLNYVAEHTLGLPKSY